jgi:hypothetical protein
MEEVRNARVWYSFTHCLDLIIPNNSELMQEMLHFCDASNLVALLHVVFFRIQAPFPWSSSIVGANISV